MDDGFAFSIIYGSALIYYPAMLVIIGATVFLIGFLPKFTGFTWLYITYSFLALYLGGLFQFPDWVGKLSPFDYIPQLPVENMIWTPVILFIAIAGLLIGLGFIGYGKRDIDG